MPAREARERGPRERHVHEMHVYEMYAYEMRDVSGDTIGQLIRGLHNSAVA